MANCSPGPFPTNNWTIWLGPVPPQLTTFAVDDLKTEAEHPYGFEWLTTEYNGQQVMAIKQYHTWTYHGGKLVTGICIPGITLYRPKPVVVTETVAIDLNTPNTEIAWFDDGEQSTVDFILIAECLGGIAIIILLFILGVKFMKKS
jgi:hypothetical protein